MLPDFGFGTAKTQVLRVFASPPVIDAQLHAFRAPQGDDEAPKLDPQVLDFDPSAPRCALPSLVHPPLLAVVS